MQLFLLLYCCCSYCNYYCVFAVYTNTDTAPDANTPQQGAAAPIATIASPPTYESLMLPSNETVAMTPQQGAAAPTDAIDSSPTYERLKLPSTGTVAMTPQQGAAADAIERLPTYERLMLPSTAAGSRRSYRV